MAPITQVVLVIAVIGTLAAFGFVGLVQVDRVRRAADRAKGALTGAQRAKDDLDVQLAVLERERSRLQSSLDALGAARAAHRDQRADRW